MHATRCASSSRRAPALQRAAAAPTIIVCDSSRPLASQAASWYSRAIELSPDSPALFTNRAAALAELRKARRPATAQTAEPCDPDSACA